jgi:hypothetical protein
MFFCLLLFEGTLASFFKEKVEKKSQNSRSQGFSYYFCLMIEGSGSVPLTGGSGSRRPKNIWIRRIQIRNNEEWYIYPLKYHCDAEHCMSFISSYFVWY